MFVHLRVNIKNIECDKFMDKMHIFEFNLSVKYGKVKVIIFLLVSFMPIIRSTFAIENGKKVCNN